MTYYRHYKGGLYTFLTEGVHTETEEEMVVYSGEDGRVWVRPKAMFFENLPDGTPRFRLARDPSIPRWRPIPGWCDEDGRGWQLSDCGRIRNTEMPDYVHNDHGEIVGVVYDELDFSPTHIELKQLDDDDKMVLSIFDFTEIKKAVSESRPPVPFKTFREKPFRMN